MTESYDVAIIVNALSRRSITSAVANTGFYSGWYSVQSSFSIFCRNPLSGISSPWGQTGGPFDGGDGFGGGDCCSHVWFDQSLLLLPVAQIQYPQDDHNLEDIEPKIGLEANHLGAPVAGYMTTCTPAMMP